MNNFLSILIDFKENNYIAEASTELLNSSTDIFLKMGGNLDVSQFIEKEVVLMVPRRCY